MSPDERHRHFRGSGWKLHCQSTATGGDRQVRAPTPASLFVDTGCGGRAGFPRSPVPVLPVGTLSPFGAQRVGAPLRRQQGCGRASASVFLNGTDQFGARRSIPVFCLPYRLVGVLAGRGRVGCRQVSSRLGTLIAFCIEGDSHRLPVAERHVCGATEPLVCCCLRDAKGHLFRPGMVGCRRVGQPLGLPGVGQACSQAERTRVWMRRWRARWVRLLPHVEPYGGATFAGTGLHEVAHLVGEP